MKPSKKKVTRSLHRSDHQMNNPSGKEKSVLNHSSTDGSILGITDIRPCEPKPTPFKDHPQVGTFLAKHCLSQESNRLGLPVTAGIPVTAALTSDPLPLDTDELGIEFLGSQIKKAKIGHKTSRKKGEVKTSLTSNPSSMYEANHVYRRN